MKILDKTPLTVFLNFKFRYSVFILSFSSLYQVFQQVLRACVRSRFSRVGLFGTPCTVAHQAPPSMGLSRQEYWRGLPCPPPRDLPNPGMEPCLRVFCIGRRVLYTQHHLGSPVSAGKLKIIKTQNLLQHSSSSWENRHYVSGETDLGCADGMSVTCYDERHFVFFSPPGSQIKC